MAAHQSPPRGTTQPLFGRQELTGEVGRLLEQTAEGKGQGLLLSGPAGIGKSQFLRSVVDQARTRRFVVLSGRALPEELPSPFSLIRDVLRSTVTRSQSDPPSETGGDRLPIFLAPYATGGGDRAYSDRGATGPTAGEDDLEGLLTPLTSASPEGHTAGRDEILSRLGEYLRGLSHAQPILLAIDDLQFADDSSLDFWRRFAPDLAGGRIAFVATVAPPSELPARTREAVEALEQAPGFRRLVLRSMTAPEVGEFARWILGDREPDRADVLRWHAQTEGNPLFVEQLVRAATGYGASVIRSTQAGAGGHDVTEILIARTQALGESERRLLTYAAVLGKEFEFSKLATVAGFGEERVTESLDRLVQDGLVREKGGEVYEFVTEAIRVHVYGELTETRRRLLHRKAGRALDAVGGVSDSELARQFYLGRDDEKAVEHNWRAAQSAARAFAFETAVSHLARALEAQRRRPGSDLRGQLRLLNEEGRLLDELGELRRSEEVLLEAVDIARSRSGLDLELGHALLGLAQTRADRAEYASATTLATEATDLLARVGSPRDLLSAHRIQGTVAWRLGDLKQAEKHRQEALAIAEIEGSPLEQGHALVDLANTMVPLGSSRFDTALALYARAASLFATGADHAAQARVLMNRAVLEYGVDRIEEAFQDLHLAIAAAEQSRSPIWIGYCHINLAQWNAELHHPVPAHLALDRAVQAVGPLGDRLAAQQVAMTRGMVAEAERAYDAAEAHYQDGLAQATALGTPVEVSEMLFRLAHLAHARGDSRAAREGLTAALAAGLREHRPDLGARVTQLERALAPE